MAGVRGVEHQRVGSGAGHQPPDIGATQGGGSAPGDRQQGFVDGQPALAHRQGQRQRDGGRVAGARVAVARHRDRGARVEQGPAVGIGLPGAEVADREQGGDGVGAGEGLDVARR